MSKNVRPFRSLLSEDQAVAGGKGGTLARLFQAGYPVPDGFVILPSAFDDDQLRIEAWDQVTQNLADIRRQNGRTAFAVRSSALAEDSAYASFAGEFETVLDVHSDDAVRAAIQQVHQSRNADRVKAYSAARGIEPDQEIAVVVQKLIRADLSGILFTADPVTGDTFTMIGNYVFGFGEELVSGEVEPYSFSLRKPKGSYQGPPDLNQFAKKLYQLASRLEEDLGGPQDIEWAIADGELYLLQSRPITTLLEYDPQTGEWNSSFSGDYVWIGSEVFPDVMTPSSHSLFKRLYDYDVVKLNFIGNIGGRFYMNFSLMDVLMRAFGKSREFLLNYIKLSTGFNLQGVELPEIPLSRWTLIKAMFPVQRKMLPLQSRLMKQFDEIIAANPARCQELHQRIQETADNKTLIALWHEAVFPLFYDLLMIQDKANEDYFLPYLAGRDILLKFMEDQAAERCLANLIGSSGQLTSIKPLLGLAQVARGKMSREAYTLLAGHRSLHEDELSAPRPSEDPNWIDQRIAEFNDSPVDYESMIAKRSQETARAWDEFSAAFPKQSAKVKKKLARAALGMEQREIIRSELTRSISVIRAWFLQAGALTDLSSGVFFLEDHEVLDVLAGKEEITASIPIRRAAYERQKALPKYPMVIRGRFDPYIWAKDPARRSDRFDPQAAGATFEQKDTLTGLPGSAGRVEGVVRIVHNPLEEHRFEAGEILVASSTNVGWTPLFPKAAAVITDIGAPLSHAAIVARELGIPAVVGVGNATRRLRTGDRVQVDGGQGTVKILT